MQHGLCETAVMVRSRLLLSVDGDIERSIGPGEGARSGDNEKEDNTETVCNKDGNQHGQQDWREF